MAECKTAQQEHTTENISIESFLPLPGDWRGCARLRFWGNAGWLIVPDIGQDRRHYPFKQHHPY